jgi:DNA-binding IscR family transcriptional regulator
MELCIALEDPAIQPRCMLGNDTCSKDRACPAHQFCSSHRANLTEFLQNTTIADIAAFETRRRWKHSQSNADAAVLSHSAEM